MKRKYQVWSGDPSDPNIEKLEADKVEVNPNGDLLFLQTTEVGMHTTELKVVGSYAAGFWFRMAELNRV